MYAVREGVEPSRGDSIDNTTLASWWSTPYYQSISVSPPTRQVGTSAMAITETALFRHSTLLLVILVF